ncbi:MAG TPA: hypothetical protein VFX60_18140 [Micromonospora sp.]|nr:hypothetical protein [Micromonospora sp.]
MTALAGVAQNIDINTSTTTTTTPVADERVVAEEPRDNKPVLPFLPAPEPKPKAPAKQDLVPGTPQGRQERFTPTAEQMANAKQIVEAAEKEGLPERAAVIGVATSLQESKLINLGHLGARNDHDSQGLFQQRPSTGWGTVEQITDPEYSSTAFYKGLKQVDGWEQMPLTRAAQTVQVSAYPDAYAQWEEMAADIVLATHDTGPYVDIAAEAEKDNHGKTDKGKTDNRKADKNNK